MFIPSEGVFLNNFIIDTGGIDLGSAGSLFTWQNNRDFFGLVKEKLDRAIASAEWLLYYPRAGVSNLPISDSDHSPIVIDLFKEKENLIFPFRYFEAWGRDGSCREIVQKAWDMMIAGCASF